MINNSPINESHAHVLCIVQIYGPVNWLSLNTFPSYLLEGIQSTRQDQNHQNQSKMDKATIIVYNIQQISEWGAVDVI